MRFFSRSKSILLMTVACFFCVSCSFFTTLDQPLDFEEDDVENIPVQEPEQEASQTNAASGMPILRTPQTKAEFITSLETLYAAQQEQGLKIALIQDSLARQKNELASLQKNLSDLVPVKKASTAPTAGVPKTAATENVGTTPESERKVYNTALNTLESGAAQAAEKLFTDFLSAYPKSSLAPNAEYWLGECFYNQKRYSDAILAFQNVAAQYPKHHKAPASLLKIGYAYEHLSDRQNAVFHLQQLLENYPGSEPEQLARSALNRFR